MSLGKILYLSIGFAIAFSLLAYMVLTPGDQLVVAAIGGAIMGHVLMMGYLEWRGR